MVDALPLQIGIPGGPELLIILLIAVLLFGANKIPKLARSTGEAMGEFQKGREEVEQELEDIREGVSAESDAEAEPTAGAGTETDVEPGAEPEPEPANEPEGAVESQEGDFEIADAEDEAERS